MADAFAILERADAAAAVQSLACRELDDAVRRCGGLRGQAALCLRSAARAEAAAHRAGAAAAAAAAAQAFLAALAGDDAHLLRLAHTAVRAGGGRRGGRNLLAPPAAL
jgi:hypothetical protein